MKNKYSVYAKNMFLKGKWEPDVELTVELGVVRKIERTKANNADYKVEYLTPALIDNHIHGGNGLSNKPTTEGLIDWLMCLAKAGVGGVMYAPYGNFVEQYQEALGIVKDVMNRQKNGEIKGAKLLGVHLEGPFLSSNRPGSFAEDVLMKPSVERYKEITKDNESIVKEMTIAPELDGATEVITYLKEQGVRILAGHTDCDYDTALEAFSHGVGAVCHTFNASTPIHHRNPGVVTAALISPDIYCEAIADLEHLNGGILKLIAKCKGRERMMIISDAVSTTNCPDGIYDENGVTIEVKNGVSRVKDLGCLNGGGCYISKSVKNLVKIGFTFEDAIMAASVNPARWQGRDVQIAEGKNAFMTAWNDKFEPTFNFLDAEIYTCQVL